MLLRVHQEVLWLEVSVHYAVLVHKCDPSEQLEHERLQHHSVSEVVIAYTGTLSATSARDWARQRRCGAQTVLPMGPFKTHKTDPVRLTVHEGGSWLVWAGGMSLPGAARITHLQQVPSHWQVLLGFVGTHKPLQVLLNVLKNLQPCLGGWEQQLHGHRMTVHAPAMPLTRYRTDFPSSSMGSAPRSLQIMRVSG